MSVLDDLVSDKVRMASELTERRVMSDDKMHEDPPSREDIINKVCGYGYDREYVEEFLGRLEMWAEAVSESMDNLTKDMINMNDEQPEE